MSAKIFASLFAVALTALTHLSAVQQQPANTIPRIGYVSGAGDISVQAFRQGLRELGYIEGKNILVEYRHAEGKLDRAPALVAELLELKLDVLVTLFLPGIRAAKKATKTIPIVFVTGVDPAAAGIVHSLARPGGNITGLTALARDLSGKRLELLTEAISNLSRVGVLWDANAEAPTMSFKEYETAARALKIPLQSLAVRGPNPDLEAAFQTATKGRANALIVISNPVFTRHAKRIADLAIRNRLPSMYERSPYVETGGLMSYSSNVADSYRRAANYVDKILKGTKPAELPVEQPKKFELIINLKAAKQIG